MKISEVIQSRKLHFNTSMKQFAWGRRTNRMAEDERWGKKRLNPNKSSYFDRQLR